MFAIDHIVLLAAVLLLVGTVSSKLSARAGLPVLVLFVGVGMLAGSEGIGGIDFEDYRLAHALGTVALAVILFDGGIRTSFRAIRPALAPALVLATAGVLVTASVMALAAALALGLGATGALLLGSIVASTDAAAVFATLRSSGLRLPHRLAAVLEVESGANDPMAVFLTLGLVQVLLGRLSPGAGMLGFFVQQMVLGAVVGLATGRLTVFALDRVELRATGLYPVLTVGAGLLAYGLAATIGGSGFLSVYLAGVVLGSHRIPFRNVILLFHDALAWLAQIAMFVVLGLLSFPSRLLHTAGSGLLLAAVLVVAARPLAALVSLAPFRFRLPEIAFVSWAGLRGAIPIILATYPLLLGVPGASRLFDGVFFVVLVSAIVQGWSLPLVGRLLGLERETDRPPPVSLEITSLRHADGDIVEFVASAGTALPGRTIRELALPPEAVVAMIARGERIIPPRGSTRIEPDDRVFFVVTSEARPLLDTVVARGRAGALPTDAEFPLRGTATVADLLDVYGVALPGAPETTLAELLRDRLGPRLAVGRGVDFGPVKLRVRELAGGVVDQVGLSIVATAPDEGQQPPVRA